jgi:DNA-binding Xre family transcriptional regulator
MADRIVLHENVSQLLDGEDLTRYLRLEAPWRTSREALIASRDVLIPALDKINAACITQYGHQELLKTTTENYNVSDQATRGLHLDDLKAKILKDTLLENTICRMANGVKVHRLEHDILEKTCKALEARMSYLIERAAARTNSAPLPYTEYSTQYRGDEEEEWEPYCEEGCDCGNCDYSYCSDYDSYSDCD